MKNLWFWTDFNFRFPKTTYRSIFDWTLLQRPKFKIDYYKNKYLVEDGCQSQTGYNEDERKCAKEIVADSTDFRLKE